MKVYVVSREKKGRDSSVFCVYLDEKDAGEFVNLSNQIDSVFTYDYEEFDVE